MTREQKLKEVLNVRLDVPLAAELRRIAGSTGQSESEVARQLMGYGVDVWRQLESQRLSRPYRYDYPSRRDDDDPEPPGVLEIEARWRRATMDELRFIDWPWPEDGSDFVPEPDDEP